jgi:type I restriction enzyme S subunit
MLMKIVGYKHTPLGWIPEDWEVKRLEEISAIQQGVSKGRLISIDNAITVPYMRVANVKDGEIDLTEVKQITIHKSELAKYTLAEGDILITEGGDPDKLGRGGLWMDSIENCVFQNHLFRIRASRKKLYYSYLFNFFQSFGARTYFLSCAKQTTGIASINSSQVKATPIPLPPLPEQRRIAAILSTWDAAIAKEQQLIDALQARHRALMQHLLSGKKRLSGFTEEWREVRLQELFERVTRKNLEQNTTVVTISAQRGFIMQTDFFNKVIASDITDNYFLVKRGEFCYNKSYSNGYPWGTIKRLYQFEKGVVTTLYICFRVQNEKQNSGAFFEHFFESRLLEKGLMKIAHEGGRAHGLLNVTPYDFFQLKIFAPPFNEQMAIAGILNTSDQEIQIHRRRLAALQQQKKGLMQVLLTGKVRVKSVGL